MKVHFDAAKLMLADPGRGRVWGQGPGILGATVVFFGVARWTSFLRTLGFRCRFVSASPQEYRKFEPLGDDFTNVSAFCARQWIPVHTSVPCALVDYTCEGGP